MTVLAHKCVRSFPNNSALNKYLRVKLSSGYLAAAGIGEDELGLTEENTQATDDVGSVRLPSSGETVYATASGAVTQYADVYEDASGKITATVQGKRWGIALDAASADGDVIEVLRTPGPDNQPGLITEEITFTEDGDTTYTGSVNVPAGATIVNIQVQNVALWDDGTSAALNVGDAADADGFFAAVNLKATDLTAGQVIDFRHQGGVGGAYITEGTSTHFLSLYSASARVISGVVTTGAQDGTAGRTRMLVTYALPNSVAATGA